MSNARELSKLVVAGEVQAGAMDTYDTIAELPLTGVDVGTQAYVAENNRLYIFAGGGWFNIALINTAPTITSGGAGSYELAQDGTPTVITLVAEDPEGVPITWSHTVTSGALGSTATVTQADNVFTITPSTDQNNAGEFTLTFTASDGVNIATDVNSFSLSFIPDWAGMSGTENQKLIPSGSTGQYLFGESISMSGDSAIIGAYHDATNGNTAGAAYIFTTSGSTWTEQQKLLPSDPAASDHFGFSVAISGDTAVIGAPYKMLGSFSGAGAAYIFTRSGSTWTQQQKITPSGIQPNQQFGERVAIDGDTVVVGCQGYDDYGIYVFTRSGSTWSQQQEISPSGVASGDFFGCDVAISADTIIAGCKYDDDGATNAGAAYIFTRSGSTWSQQQKIQHSDRQNEDLFGFSVAIDGDTAVVGADAKSSYRGYVYVFTRSGSSWSQQQKLQASDGANDDRFGSSVDITGESIAIGAMTADYNSLDRTGAAYIFTRSGSSWSQQKLIRAASPGQYDQLGEFIALDGETVMACARYHDLTPQLANAGAVYVFTAG